jgi:hypothetical protein
MGHPTVDCEECGRVFYMGELETCIVIPADEKAGEDAGGYPNNAQFMDLCPECKQELKGESL